MTGRWYGVQVYDPVTADYVPCDCQPRTKSLARARTRYEMAKVDRPGEVLRLVSLAGKTWTVTGVIEHVGSVRPADRVKRGAS